MTTQTTTKKTAKAVPSDVTELPTVSAQIRALDAQGWARADIARALGKRYQHVRNVLTQPLKNQG